LSSECSAEEIASIADTGAMETWTQIAAGVEIVCDNADGIIEGFNLTYHTKAYIGIEVIRNVTLWCFQTSG